MSIKLWRDACAKANQIFKKQVFERSVSEFIHAGAAVAAAAGGEVAVPAACEAAASARAGLLSGRARHAGTPPAAEARTSRPFLGLRIPHRPCSPELQKPFRRPSRGWFD